MTRTQKLGALAATGLLAAGCGIGHATATHPAPPRPVSTVVSSFNDGFSSAKQDDCQQGFATACAWGAP